MYTPAKLSIKSWAEEDRPREKLLLKGKHSLSDAELLAIIIGAGNTENSAVLKGLPSVFGSLRGLLLVAEKHRILFYLELPRVWRCRI